MENEPENVKRAMMRLSAALLDIKVEEELSVSDLSHIVIYVVAQYFSLHYTREAAHDLLLHMDEMIEIFHSINDNLKSEETHG